MNCPICQHKLSELSTSCKQCGSDLSQLSLLESIEDRYVDNLKSKISMEGELIEIKKKSTEVIKQYKKQRNRCFLLLLLLPLVSFFCAKQEWLQQLQPEANAQVDTVYIPIALQDTLNSYKEQITSLKRYQVNEADSTSYTIKSHAVYIVKEGDELRHLGELFFNDWRAAYQIAKDNGISNTRRLIPGDTLVINYRYE